MILLAEIWDKPMLIWFVIPIVALLLWAFFLVWDSRLPPEKKVLKRLRDAHRQRKEVKHRPGGGLHHGSV